MYAIRSYYAEQAGLDRRNGQPVLLGDPLGRVRARRGKEAEALLKEAQAVARDISYNFV